MMKLIVDENLLSFKVLEQKVCDKCSLPVPLYSSNSVEKLCDEWVLSTSVCGTGVFSAHTATHSISGNAHETQNFSTKLRKTKKVPTTNTAIT